MKQARTEATKEANLKRNRIPAHRVLGGVRTGVIGRSIRSTQKIPIILPGDCVGSNGNLRSVPTLRCSTGDGEPRTPDVSLFQFVAPPSSPMSSYVLRATATVRTRTPHNSLSTGPVLMAPGRGDSRTKEPLLSPPPASPPPLSLPTGNSLPPLLIQYAPSPSTRPRRLFSVF